MYEGGILLKQLFMANTVSAKSGCYIEKILFNEKQWNIIIHFITSVKLFFATYWTLTMASGALWSRRCYPLLPPMKFPGQTIFPMIYWRHPLLQWRMAFLYQITGFIWWVFHSKIQTFLFVPLIRPYFWGGGLGYPGLKFSQISQNLQALLGLWEPWVAARCIFPMVNSQSQLTTLSALEQPNTALRQRLDIKQKKHKQFSCTFKLQHIVSIAQPPIWKFWIHLQIMATQLPFNEPRTQQPQKDSRIFSTEAKVQRWRILLMGKAHFQQFFIALED